MAQEVVERGAFRALGVKPASGDQVYSGRVPDSPYAIRMWEGGMGPYDQFSLDFYDTERRVPVNLRQGYALYPAPVMPSGFGFGGGRRRPTWLVGV